MTASIFKSALEKATAAKENLTPRQYTHSQRHLNMFTKVLYKETFIYSYQMYLQKTIKSIKDLIVLRT